jgi:hypothetical protein
MIYLIHGDAKKSFKKAEQLVDSMLQKKPDATVLKLGADNWEEGMIDELIGGQSLFTKKYIVQMSRLLQKEAGDIGEVLLDRVKDIGESENIFVWIEPDIKKADLKKIEKHAEKVQEFDKPSRSGANSTDEFQRAKARGFNMFSLADAFGERNAKKLWVLYQEALRVTGGGGPEEIFGILWWQLKSIILVTKTKTAKEAGVKEFPYNKARRFSKNFSVEELDRFAAEMMRIYHEARRGGAELETRLEKFILSIGK